MEENVFDNKTENGFEAMPENEVEDAVNDKPAKKSLKDRFLTSLKDIGSVFKDKPVTMAVIMILALLFAIATDFSTDSELRKNIMEIMNYAVYFCAAYVFHALFIEEVIIKKLYKIYGFVYALFPSIFISYTANITGDLIFGIEKDLFCTYETIFFSVYYGIIFLCSLYHMYRDSGLSFERYCIDTFCALVRSCAVYVLFAGGTAIIIWIFNELIFDIKFLLSKVEIFLLAGLFVPSVLLALSRKKESYGKFAQLVIFYVLEPMMVLTYAIIYVYILKIFVTQDMPSNSVFSILAFVFTLAMPIWTMAQGIESDSIFKKISHIVPLVFIPFIVLQIYCIALRISDYGITGTRYLAVLLVIFEIAYMVLYILQFINHKTNQKPYAQYLFYVLIALLIISLWIPGLNYMDVVVNSQTQRVKLYLQMDNLTDEQKHNVYDAYRVCICLNCIAEKRFLDRFDEVEIATIKEFEEYNWYDPHEKEFRNHSQYKSAHRSLEYLDVTKYKTMQYVSLCISEKTASMEVFEKAAFSKGNNYIYENDEDTIILDISPVIDFIAQHSEYECRDALENMDLIDVGNGQKLYVTEFSTVYYPVSGEYENTRIFGYLFSE